MLPLCHAVLQLVRLFRQLQLIRLFRQLEVRQRLKRALAAEDAALVGAADSAGEVQQHNLAEAEARVMAKYNTSHSRVGQRLSGEQPGTVAQLGGHISHDQVIGRSYSTAVCSEDPVCIGSCIAGPYSTLQIVWTSGTLYLTSSSPLVL